MTFKLHPSEGINQANWQLVQQQKTIYGYKIKVDGAVQQTLRTVE